MWFGSHWTRNSRQGGAVWPRNSRQGRGKGEAAGCRVWQVRTGLLGSVRIPQRADAFVKIVVGGPIFKRICHEKSNSREGGRGGGGGERERRRVCVLECVSILDAHGMCAKRLRSAASFSCISSIQGGRGS